MSERGAGEIRAIIALEPILGELERQAGRETGLRRDPGALLVRGLRRARERDGSAPWSWRIGGHHVAIHVTVADGRVIGSTPSFLGANPATVPNGPTAGARAIDGEERLARDLLGAAVPGRSGRSRSSIPIAPPDILSGNGRRADLRDVPTGIRFDQLEAAQRRGLERLIRHYLERSHPDMAAAEWDRIARRRPGVRHVRLGRAGRPGSRPLLRGPRPEPADRVRQHPERRQPHPLACGATRPTTGARTSSPTHYRARHGPG